MAEVAKGIIDIEINTGSAASQLQALQTQINAFNLALNKSNKAQGTFAAEYSKELQSAINKTGLFTAETIRLSTAAATLDKTLSKGKTTLGQFFSAKFNKDSAIAAETMALAAERAKRLQTQFIATSGAANGFQEAIAVRPLAAFSSEAAVAAQRTQILSNMFKQGTTQLINFGKNVQWAGRQLMVGFTVPLTIFGSVAGKTFMELEKQAVAFKKVYGDIFTTPAELDKNLEAVKGLASEYTKYGIAVKDTIGLAAQAAAAGRQNADLTDAVSQATRLATLGQMDQNAALETTISLQSAFRLSGKDLADTINFLNMVENQTVVSLQDIAAAIPRVAPVIQGLGGNVKDLTVFLAAMQEGGVDAAEGANALKSGLASLINPTKQATEMLNGMGINLETIIQANRGDLMGTVQAFAQALAGLDQFSRQQALEQVFGKFQYAKLGALFDNISRKGSQAQQVIATMGYSTEQLGATADKELKTIEESFGVQLTGAVERFKLAIAPIGQLFVQLAIPVVNFVTKIVDGFNSLSDGQKKFTAIAAVIVGVVVPAVTMLAGLFLNLVGTLAKMTQGMALFSKGFITGGPIGAFKALSQSSKYLSLAEMDAAMAAQQLSGASQVLNATLIEQVGTANAAAAAIANLTKAYSAMISTQGAAGALPSFGVASAAGTNAAKGTKTGSIRVRGIRRNSGGGVPGVGNTDTVPAMLTPGEFVVNKEATSKNLGLLKAINDGGVQKLNGGGEVLDEIAAVKALGFGGSGKVSPSQMSSRVSSGAFNLGNAPQELIQELIDALTKAGAPNNIIEELGRFISPTPRRGSYDFNNRLRTKEVSRREMVSLFNMSKFTHGSGPKVSPFQYLYDDIGGVSSDIDKQIRKSAIGIAASYPKGHLFSDPDYGDIFVKAVEEANIDDATKSSLLESAVRSQKPGARRAGRIAAFAERAGLTRALKPDGKPYKRPTFMFTGADGRQIKVVTGATLDIPGASSYQRIKNIPGYNRAHVISQVIKSLAIRRNSGGPVPGTGNTDTVPAMLTPGEFVVNKKAASQNQQLLEMMNGGNVRGYALGGVVTGAGTAAQFGGMATGNMPLMIAGTVVQMLGPLLGKAAGKGGTDGGPSGISGTVKNLGPVLKNIATVGGRLSIGMTSMVGGVALAGIAIYKLNESARKAEKAGAELAEAMYGSAKTTKAMADAFGRETNASALRRKAVEKAGGQEITQESIAASGEFMKSDAAAGIIEDLKLVKKSGEDASLALRNQLASSIIAGAITPEEAKAIAIDMGKAIGDERIAIKVAGQLSTLLGPNGERLNKNIVEITAEITPKIDSQKIKSDADKAYEELNIGQKFGQLFSGGRQDFIEDFAIDEISERNASALAKEAESRAFLNLAYQEGTITLKEYLDQESKITSGANQRSSFIDNANAQALGFSSTAAMQSKLQEQLANLNVDTTGMSTLQASEAQALGQARAREDSQGKAAYDAIVTKSKEALKQSFVDAGMDQDIAKTMTDSMEQGVAQIDPGIFDKFLSGQIPQEGYDILMRLESAGDLTADDIDRIGKELTVINTIPDINKMIDFNSSDEEKLTELYDDYVKLEAEPDIYKGISIKDQFSETMNQFGIDWAWLSSLPNQEKIILIRNMETYEKYNSLAAAEKASGYVEGGTRQQQNNAARSLNQSKQTFGQTPTITNDGTGSGGGGGGKQTLAQYIKEFEKATKAKEAYLKATIGMLGTEKQEALALIDTEMYLKANAKQRENLISLAERQLDVQRATAFLSLSSSEKEILSLEMKGKVLDKNAEKESKSLRDKQRQIELNDREIQRITEQEDAVNKAYDSRLEALDKVSQANDRIAEQDRSRIGLASALASGDIAAAANAASEMQQQEAQYKIEDTKSALEIQRQRDLAPFIEARTALEEKNKGIQLQIQAIEDHLYDIETQRTALAEQRAKAEERIYLLQQKQTIEALKKQKNLTPEQAQSLARLEQDFANIAGTSYAQYKKYGGSIAKMAFGGTAYKGSNEPPPALRMNYGSTVPGIGMTDKVPALLTPGEFVVRKSVAKQYGGFLNQLNGQVFPGMGRRNEVPTNNFLDGIGSPRYSVPQSSISDIPVNSTNVVSTSAPMYNSTYNVNVNVSGTNASPDDIANVVMAKLSQQNRGNLRSSRY